MNNASTHYKQYTILHNLYLYIQSAKKYMHICIYIMRTNRYPHVYYFYVCHDNSWQFLGPFFFTKTSKVHIVEVHGIWSSSSGRPTFSNASCIPKVPTRPGPGRWLDFFFGGKLPKKKMVVEIFLGCSCSCGTPPCFFFEIKVIIGEKYKTSESIG